VVSILSAKDSILYTFQRSDDKGNFELKNLKAGEYILLFTYPEYADYVEKIVLTDTSAFTFQVPMILKANLLKEVIVRQAVSAIRMKGDTTEYAADSF